jgi:cell division protein FtsL
MQSRRNYPFFSHTLLKNREQKKMPQDILFSTSFITTTISQRMLIIFATLLFLVSSLLFLTWVRISQMQSGYALAKLESQHIALQEQVRALELEIAVLKRPERIRRIAMQELKLVMPNTHQIIRHQKSLDKKNALAQ